jgi:sugar lactone lactonase YvrE
MVSLRAVLILALASWPAAASPPATGPATVFAGGLDGPEGLAFLNDGTLAIGSTTGRIVRLAADGTASELAQIDPPERLAGLTTLRDGRLLAAGFGSGTIWAIDPATGAVSPYATGIAGPNFVVQTRRGRVYASASLAGTLVEVGGGSPITVATGLSFPNGLALAGDGFIYVVELGLARISRFPLLADGGVGAAEVYASGLPLADGIAFDRRRNLLVVGQDTLWVIDRRTRAAAPLPADPLLDWPSNLAFGRSRGFGRKNLYLTNFGPGFGDGTTVVRMPYSLRGARLIR